MLVSEWRFLFAELESLKESEALLRKDNQILQAKCIEQETRYDELKAWATYDEQSHEQYTEQLKKEGLTVELL